VPQRVRRDVDEQEAGCVVMKASVPVTPGARYSTRVGGSRHRRGSGRGSGLAYLIGGILLVVVIALFIVIALILGGLVLTGYGIYLGILARRHGSLHNAQPPTVPISTQEHAPIAPSPAPTVVGRTVFGLEPSYGRSRTCVLIGLVMFIGGIAAGGSTNDPQSQTAPVTRGSQPSTSLPTATPTTNREPVVTAPVLPASPIPTTTVARQAAPPTPAKRVDTPSERTTARPPPVAPQRDNDSSDVGAVYYKNCDAARAAGAAPIKRGEPGYRPALDRDNDGTACDK
jgi:Excalibur calcium-binding domain